MILIYVSGGQDVVAGVAVRERALDTTKECRRGKVRVVVGSSVDQNFW